MRIAVSGSSGLVGSAVVSTLRARGHEVLRLVRSEPDPSAGRVLWDPLRGEIDAASLEGVDGVVHLAGESVSGGRWNERRKAAIRESRIEGSRILSLALASLTRPPSVLIQASAMGFYGDRGEEVLDEQASVGEGFLADLARDWEAQSVPAAEAGIRVVHPRISLVLSKEGGAWPRLVKPFRMGLGGKLGNGRQWMSWIHLEDLVEVIVQGLEKEEWSGALNACTSTPMRNVDFGHAIGRRLHRPTAFPAPAWVLRLLLGEMADGLLLASVRMKPAVLEASEFRFRYADLGSALDELLS